MPSLPLEVDLGVIEMWSGSLVSIPQGWVLCDGTNGTPDMRDRFLIGAPGVFIPGDTDDSLDHNHTFTGDGHSHDPSGPPALSAVIPSIQGTTSTEQITGTTDNTEPLPPYYSLAYVMFIGH